MPRTKSKCSVPKCNRDVGANGWCAAHNSRYWRDGDVRHDVPIRKRRTGKPSPTCSVKGCRRPHSGHSFCAAHLHRWHRFGDAFGRIPIGDPAIRKMIR